MKIARRNHIFPPLSIIMEANKKRKFNYSLGPVHEFVCISFRTGNLNCLRVK